MKEKSLILLLFLLTSVSFSIAQDKIRPAILRIVDDIVEGGYVGGEAGAFPGAEPHQWQRYKLLNREANTNELLQLTKHSDPIVRVYAFDALVDRRDRNVYDLIQSHINDTALVIDQYGCFETRTTVAHRYIENTKSLTRTQVNTIDSIILYTLDASHKIYGTIIWRIELKPEYYTRLKELHNTTKNNFFVEKIATYNNPSDTSLIKAVLDDDPAIGLLAVVQYPHPSFYPSLKRIHAHE